MTGRFGGMRCIGSERDTVSKRDIGSERGIVSERGIGWDMATMPIVIRAIRDHRMPIGVPRVISVGLGVGLGVGVRVGI